MKFVHSKEEAVEKLHSLFPEFQNSRIIGDNSGWCNYAVVVDDIFIFRFPKNEKALKSVEKEKRVLKALKGKLPEKIIVPDYIYSDLEGDYPFVGYKMIKGKFLSKKLLDDMDSNRKEQTIELISTFIDTMHSLDKNGLFLDETTPLTEFVPLYNEIQRVAYLHFTDEEKKVTKELFEFYFSELRMSSYTPVVIHGDLSTDHILLTENGIGIIDFGDVKVFDPAYDYIFAYFLGEDFFNGLTKKNPQSDISYRIREFYYKRTPYYGIIYSIKMDNDEQFQNAMQFMHEVLLKEKEE